MSNIEWTDTTWQVTSGCTKVSSGCANCYAETMANRLAAMCRADESAERDPGHKRSYPLVVNDKGRWNGQVVTLPDRLSEPLGWKKPRRVFVNSMSDLFHEAVPFDFIDQVFAVMALCPQHTFQVLTKRPERMAEYLNWTTGKGMYRKDLVAGECMAHPHEQTIESCWCGETDQDAEERDAQWPLPNVWLGTSVENQAAADERIPRLLRCPAAVRFLSCEPLLGPVVLDGSDALRRGERGHTNVLTGKAIDTGTQICRGIDWVIVGGESGPGARGCDVAWIDSIVEQCRDSRTACFVKQLGSRPVAEVLERNERGDPTKWREFKLQDRKGGDPSEWPERLRVRQMPGGAT